MRAATEITNASAEEVCGDMRFKEMLKRRNLAR
jgi:hypothetical protein